MLGGLLRRSSADLLKQYSQVVWSSPCLERLIPKAMNSTEALSRYANLTQFTPDLNSYTEGISRPIWSMLTRRGKSWRSALCLLTAQAFGVPMSQVTPLAVSCELLHNASLIIDDVEDNSEIARGKAAVHVLFGPELTINAGCYLYFMAQMAMEEPDLSPELKLKLPEIYNKELLAMHLGQSLDLQWSRMPGYMPSYEQYMQMSASKTGALVRLALRLGATAANCPEATISKLMELGDYLGAAFQIHDDLLNLHVETYKVNRRYLGEDITSGKRTLMTIHASQNSPKARRLLELLDMKTNDLVKVSEALSILNESDSLDFSEKEGDKLADKAVSILNEVFPESRFKEQMRALVRFLMQSQQLL